MPQTVTPRIQYIITAYSIFTFSYHSHVYVNSLEEWLLRGLLHQCNKKLKNSKLSEEIGGCDFYKVQFFV